MWLIAVVACSPLFLTFLFRVAVTGAWKTFGRKLGTKLATPGVFDAFVCRQFRVDGHLNRSGVTLKTYEGETHDNPNPGGGLLGRIWERFMGGRIAYSLRIVVRPEDGIIPSDLTISRLRQPDGNVVRPSEWESTVKVTGDDFGLLDGARVVLDPTAVTQPVNHQTDPPSSGDVEEPRIKGLDAYHAQDVDRSESEVGSDEGVEMTTPAGATFSELFQQSVRYFPMRWPGRRQRVGLELAEIQRVVLVGNDRL